MARQLWALGQKTRARRCRVFILLAFFAGCWECDWEVETAIRYGVWTPGSSAITSVQPVPLQRSSLAHLDQIKVRLDA